MVEFESQLLSIEKPMVYIYNFEYLQALYHYKHMVLYVHLLILNEENVCRYI